MSEAHKKDYQRPDGFSTEDPNERPYIHNHGDYMFKKNFTTFILPYNKEQETPEPTRRWFAVGNSKQLFRGDWILVDLVNGKSQKTQVQRKDGRVLFINPPLDVSPKVPGEILKIQGIKSTQIDTRYDLETSKGQEAFEKKKQEQEIAKKFMLDAIRKEVQIKEAFRPGESPYKGV